MVLFEEPMAVHLVEKLSTFCQDQKTHDISP